MASQVDSGPLVLTAPLNHITNASASNHSPLGSHQEDLPAALGKSVHRFLSPRFLRRQFASSEASEQEEEDSIYNANPVHPGADRSWSAESLPADPIAVSAVSSRPPTPLNSPEDNPTAYSQWPVRRPSVIVERRSIHGLRKPTSVPRLTLGAARSSKIVQPQTSLHSVHVQASLRPSDRMYGCRSYSTNDLDSRRLAIATKGLSPRSTSSTGDALDSASWCPTLPNRPQRSPPRRVSTPPGLPSFGTVEATEYRLVLPQYPTRALWSRIWSRSHDSEERSPSPHMLPSPLLAPQTRPSSPPVELLKRTLARIGMSTVVNPAPEPSTSPRVSLPAGVYTCNEPGALARADDGTLIRGRFAVRASGHGVGQRNLDSHPFADTMSVEEQVREIDKVCERLDLDTALARSAWSDGARRERDHEEHEAEPDRVSDANHTVREPSQAIGSQQLQSDDGSAMSPSVFLSPPSASLSRLDLPIPFRSFDPPWIDHHGYRMHAPMRYAPLRAPSTVSSLRVGDTTAVTSSFADEAERERIRELVMEDKRREQSRPWNQLKTALEDCCYDLWDSWYVRCSGDLRG